MAKGVNDGKPKRSHNYRPYDTSNSFVKRVASKVSELLPQPISRWLTSSSQEPAQEIDRYDQDEEEEQQRPSKRLCLNQPVNDYTHQNNVGRLSNQCVNEGDVSPILSNPLDDYAIPGPSGLHLRKTENFVSSTPAIPPNLQHTQAIQKLNDAGDDGSDSSDSTSGCSSLVPQSDKASSFSAMRTLHTSETPNLSASMSEISRQRTLFPKTKYPRVDFSHSSSRGMPVFDPMIFHSPFKSASANTSLKDDISNSSPFYRGRTMYGGASSCREALTLPSPSTLRTEVPRIINIRPEQSVTFRDSMGDTAKKILEVLEKFSTPVMDAKRIPMKQASSSGQKRKLPQPYQELSIPQMPDLLRIKRRESQLRKAVAEMPSTSTQVPIPSSPPKPVEEYSLRDNIHEDGTSHVGCVKSKEKDLMNEPAPKINLPNISLPVSSLPVINISLPKPPPPLVAPSPLLQPVKTPVAPKPLPVTATPQPLPIQGSFKFSEPISQSVKINIPHTITSEPKSTYKFSAPLDAKEGIEKKRTPLTSNDVLAEKSPVKEQRSADKTDSSNILQSIMKTGTSNFKLKRKQVQEEESSSKFGVLSPATELKSGSVMDFFAGKKSEGSSSALTEFPKCKKCNVQIEKDKVECDSCETKSLEKNKQDIVLSESKSKLSSEKCLCEKSGNDTKCIKCGPQNVNKTEDEIEKEEKSAVSKLSGFEGVYKPPANTWECKICLVRNNAAASACVACSSPKEDVKPTAAKPQLNDLFKKAEGAWECDTCLVQNKAGVDTCVACGTLRPGATAPVKQPVKSTFTFGIPSSSMAETKNGGLGFSFGSNDLAKDVIPSVGFTFGAVKPEAKNEKNSVATFKFGSNETPDAKPVFSFGSLGAPNKEDDKEKKETSTTFAAPVTSAPIPVVSFNFMPNVAMKEPETNQKEHTEEKEDQPPKKRVSFGVPLTEELKIPEAKPPVSTTFIFGSTPSTKVETSAPSLFSNSNLSSVPTSSISNSIFKFGAPTNTVANSKEKPETTETTEIPKTSASGFTFGSTSNSIPAFTNKEKKPLWIISNDKPKTFSSETPSIFNSTLPSTEQKEKPPFESMENKSVVPSTTIKTEMSSSIFGPMSKKTSIFGSSSTETGKAPFFNSSAMGDNNKSLFGSQSESWKLNFNCNPEPAAPFRAPQPVTTTTSAFTGFGSTAPTFTNMDQNATAPTPAFTFNAVANQTATPSVFPFKPETENKPQVFAFGARPAIPSSGGFSFSVSQTTTANSFPPPPTFSAAPTASNPNPPLLIGGSNIFGSSAPPPSAPFAFGAPQQQEPQQPGAVFNFSSNQPQATAAQNTSTFSFGSQNASGPSTAFDPNIKPSFNFTGGATPSFSATPTAPSLKHPDRKIRRGVRRTQTR